MHCEPTDSARAFPCLEAVPDGSVPELRAARWQPPLPRFVHSSPTSHQYRKSLEGYRSHRRRHRRRSTWLLFRSRQPFCTEGCIRLIELPGPGRGLLDGKWAGRAIYTRQTENAGGVVGAQGLASRKRAVVVLRALRGSSPARSKREGRSCLHHSKTKQICQTTAQAPYSLLHTIRCRVH